MRTGPVILSVVGDEYTDNIQIAAILWEGATTSGDVAEVRGRGPTLGTVFWAGRTDSTATYVGVNFGPKGIHAPDGIRLYQLSAGRVFVYPLED